MEPHTLCGVTASAQRTARTEGHASATRRAGLAVPPTLVLHVWFVWRLQDDWFPFVACIEEAGLKGIKAEDVDKVAHGCAVHAGLVPSKLMGCYGGAPSSRIVFAAQPFRTCSQHFARQHSAQIASSSHPIPASSTLTH